MGLARCQKGIDAFGRRSASTAVWMYALHRFPLRIRLKRPVVQNSSSSRAKQSRFKLQRGKLPAVGRSKSISNSPIRCDEGFPPRPSAQMSPQRRLVTGPVANLACSYLVISITLLPYPTTKVIPTRACSHPGNCRSVFLDSSCCVTDPS